MQNTYQPVTNPKKKIDNINTEFIRYIEDRKSGYAVNVKHRPE